MTSAAAAGTEELGGGNDEREWPRPLALAVFLTWTWIVGPVTLVAVPFMLLVIGLPVRRRSAWLVAAFVGVFLVGLPTDEGIQFLEFGWALAAGGLFAAASLFWPTARVTHRALGAVAGAAGLAALVFGIRPGSWSVVDWRIRDRLGDKVSQFLALLQESQGEQPIPAEVLGVVSRYAEIQATLFPAILALTTLAGLLLAWWLYGRLGAGERGALGPLREFDFEDQLVWIFIAGLVVVVLAGSEGWTRAGTNTLVFMGALYALRGAAVLLFVTGGLSVFGGILVAVGMLLLAPQLVATSALIGLGDTWLDVRTRVRAKLG